MQRQNLMFAAIASVLFIMTPEANAAAAQRTFVASYGLDTNPCSLSAPCRGFQAAINAVAAHGEVVALDSAGYGTMSIAKSVSVIVPPGIHAGLSPGAGIPLPGYVGESTVVLIDIQNADVVVLRGLNVNRQGTVTFGIAWVSTHGGTVHIENTVVNGFPQEGVFVEAVSGSLYMKDTELRGNNVGLWMRGDRGHMTTVADRLRVEGNSFAGIAAEEDVQAEIRDCNVAGNLYGIWLNASVTGGNVVLTDCMIAESNTAFYFNADVPMSVSLSASTLVDIVHGHHEFGASQNVISFGNNAVKNVGGPGPINATLLLQ